MSDTIERLPDLIERERTRFSVPGCAVTVVQDGVVVLAEGFGQRDTAHELPVTAQTLFPIGSATKTFTAALCAALVDAGRLDLDQPIRELLPGFRLQDPLASELLSVRDCLSHRSGLPRHDVIFAAGEGRLTRDDVIHRLPYLPPSRPFRETWQYNNLLYLVVGHITGQLLGMQYEEAVRQLILQPLGMGRTNFRVAQVETDDDHSRPYLQAGLHDVREIPFAHIDLAGPAGCINSCADDLGAWLLTLVGAGVDGAAPLLSDAALNEMRTPAMPIPPGAITCDYARAVGYGLGLFVEDYRGYRVTHHGGNIDGFASQVAQVPDAGVAVAVLTNAHASPLRDVITYVVLDELLGLDALPHGERQHRKWQAIRQGAGQAEAARRSAGRVLPAVRPLNDYVGQYRHEGYGDIEITADADGLQLSYLQLSGRLQHRHLEVFDAVATLAGDEARLPLQFTHDLAGDVDALHAQLEPSLPPLRFDRIPDTSSLTDEVLEALAGRYTLDALEIVVSRRGERDLLLSVVGGPFRLLTPVGGTQFSVDGARIIFAEDSLLQTPFGDFRKQL